MRNPARALFGLALVTVGALFLLEATDVIDDAGEVIARWWPVGLLAVALAAFLSNPRQWVAPVVIGAIGALTLLTTTDVVEASVWEFFWPGLIVFLGATLLVRRSGAARVAAGEDTIQSFNVFSGRELSSHSGAFRGGSIGVVFGGAEVDLRDAVPAEDARLEVFAMFGATEIRVPQGWRVDVQGFPLFGGLENVTSRDRLGPDAPRLVIDATVLFGGLEVKH